MTTTRTNLMQYILDDVNKYEGFRHPKKASLWERLCVKEVSPLKLHANPNDEFSMEDIGPNLEIISQYCDQYRNIDQSLNSIMNDSLIVEKMAPDGYMILNGHHRWAAALQTGTDKVPIKIVNLTHEEDMIHMTEHTHNDKRVAFDLDEVICTTTSHPLAEFDPYFFSDWFFKEGMRYGVPALISELRRQGYDIWIYTNTYHSVEYVKCFLRMYGVHVDGIINAANRKKSNNASSKYNAIVRDKYRISFHVDNESVLCTRRAGKSFDVIDLNASDKDWANKTMAIIKSISQNERSDSYENNGNFHNKTVFTAAQNFV